MNVDVLTLDGKKKETYDLPEHIFNVEVNKDLVHQALRAIMLGKLAPVAHTKDRSERAGGGRKPWKQKGTGRARAGSSRSPIWRKGGITFGPRNDRNFAVSINKKMKRKALFMVLSDAVKNDSFKLVDEIVISEPKTKLAKDVLANVVASADAKTLVVLPAKNENVEKAFRNLSNVKVLLADSLNVEDVLKYDTIMTSVPSIEVIKATYKV